jgi:dihydrodipicolinate synthase/N-acetylneuraminate lyase
MARAARELKLSGVFAAAITPHRTDSAEADFSGSLDLLDFLAEAGVAGISLLDAAGEFFDYSLDERQRLVYLGVKRSRVPLIAGVSHSTLSGAVHLADEAVHSGADGVLIMPPWFFRYKQPELEQFCFEFARETSDAIPILLHNAPAWTSGLEIGTVARLMQSGRFAGVVDSSGDWNYFEQLLEMRQHHPFALLSGCDRLALRALQSGADALVSPSACAIPELVVALAHSVADRNEARAAALDALLQEFVAWTQRFPAPAGIKRAVELRGQRAGSSFVPFSKETTRALDEFSEWFRKWLITMRKTAQHA